MSKMKFEYGATQDVKIGDNAIMLMYGNYKQTLFNINGNWLMSGDIIDFSDEQITFNFIAYLLDKTIKTPFILASGNDFINEVELVEVKENEKDV